MHRMPPTIVQLTDPHLGASWSEDPAGALAAAIAGVRAVLPAAPDAVVVSGDIAGNGADAEYAQARELLARLGAPVYACPGNHDDWDTLRRHFPPPPGHFDSASFAVTVGPIRLVALDSTDPGHAGGRLHRPRLRWLNAELGEAPNAPTVIVMHHPPIDTGVPAMDKIGIPAGDRRALAEILARHPQVQMIACGHVHRTVAGAIGAVPVLSVPSTDVQLGLDLTAADVVPVREPPCFAVHMIVDGRIVSHIQPVQTAAA